jgi:hypothetical protein
MLWIARTRDGADAAAAWAMIATLLRLDVRLRPGVPDVTRLLIPREPIRWLTCLALGALIVLGCLAVSGCAAGGP